MSHSGWGAANYINTTTGTIPSGVPLTMHARFKGATQPANARAATLYFDASNYFDIRTNTSIVQAVVNGTAISNGGSLSWSTGTWYSLVGVFASSTSRTVYLDGVAATTNTTSATPTGTTTFSVGGRAGVLPFSGSLADVALWNVALSADDINALAAGVSPLLIRPDALVHYLPLLDSGTLDLMAPAATVTGTLTKDNDHPRVILPRQRSLIIPKGAGGGGGEEQAVGSSAGSATAAAAGQSTARASGTIAGTSTVAATGQSTAASVGSAAGTSTAAATGAFTGEVQAVGSAAGASTASAVGSSTGGTTTDTHDGIGYGDPFRRKRRPKKGKREKAVEDLLKKLMGLVPDDPPPAIEVEAEIAQASVERLFAPTVDVTPNLEALQFAQLQLAKLEAMLNRYIEESEDEDDLLLMAA